MHCSRTLRRVTYFAVVAATVACRQQSPAPPAPVESAAWTQFSNNFVETSFKAQPFFAVYAGRHEFDGQMPDLSKAGIETEIARLNAARAAATAFDGTALSGAQRFERDYVVAVIDNDLYWLAKAEFPFRNPAWYANQLDPDIYLARTYAPIEQRMKGYINYARAIPGIAANVRANLRTPLPKSFVEYGVKAFGGYSDFYRQDVPKVFAEVKDPALQRELADVTDAAAAAMQQLQRWFEQQQRNANGNGYALGPELFAAMVRDTEGIDTPIAAIKAIGEADLARNTDSLKQTCASYAPGKTLKECVMKSKAHKAPEGPVAAARKLLVTLRAFVAQRQIVSIPSDEQALVAESPPYNAANSAYIVPAGPFETNQPSVYNISPPDPKWSKRDQEEYIPGVGKLLNTSVHEVWPGHFLQFLHSNRSQSLIGRLWVGNTFAEGWAHYSEQLMWDMGLGDGDPEIHVAQLKDALWRDVRLLSAIGLHTEGMTVTESEKMFREVALDDPGNARQQAARGTYDPDYLRYTTGKLAILKLREDWVAKQMAGKPAADPKSYWRAFHDQFLSYGGPPISLVRRAMLPGDTGSLL